MVKLKPSTSARIMLVGFLCVGFVLLCSVLFDLGKTEGPTEKPTIIYKPTQASNYHSYTKPVTNFSQCASPNTNINSVVLAGNRPVGTYLCDYFPDAPQTSSGCSLTCEVERFANHPTLRSFQCNILRKATVQQLFTSDIVVNHFGPVPTKEGGKPYITLFYQGESKAADGKRALESYLGQYDRVISFSSTFKYHYTWTHRHERDFLFIMRGDTASSDKVVGGSVQQWRSERLSAIAVFVSRCGKKKGGRDFVIQSLAKYYTVHSFGKCGRTQSIAALHPECASLNKGRYPEKMCVFKKYKFILALDNTREEDYVTEKVYHALLAGAIPIYDGAPNIDDFLPLGKQSVVMLQDFRKDPSAPVALGNADTNNQDVDFSALAEHLKAIEGSEDMQTKLFAWRTDTQWSDTFVKNLRHPEPTCEVCADALELKQCDQRQ